MAESEAVQKVLEAWKKTEGLVALAAAGMMARVKSKQHIERRDVCQNEDAIIPIIQHMGH